MSLLQKGNPTACKAQAAAKKSTKIKAHLLFLDTSLSLSMTNSGCRLNLIVCHTQILGTKFTNFTRFYGLPRSLCSLAMTARHKFKFFTQNSKHFINSIHFITLSQNLSPTQGFFIFLPQIFAQFLLINSLQRSSYGRQDT